MANPFFQAYKQDLGRRDEEDEKTSQPSNPFISDFRKTFEQPKRAESVQPVKQQPRAPEVQEPIRTQPQPVQEKRSISDRVKGFFKGASLVKKETVAKQVLGAPERLLGINTADIIGTEKSFKDRYTEFTNNKLLKQYESEYQKLQEERDKEFPDPKAVEKHQQSVNDIDEAMKNPSLASKYITSSKEEIKRDFGSFLSGVSIIGSGIGRFAEQAYERDTQLMQDMSTTEGTPKWLASLYGLRAEQQGQRIKAADTVSSGVEQWSQEVSPTNPDFMDNLVQGTGSMAGFTALAATTGIGGTGLAVTEAMQESGAVYKENRDNGQSIAEASENADKDLLANLVINYLTNKFGLYGEQAAGIKKAFLSATGEAMQEGFQQMASNYTTGKELMLGVMESMSIGAVLGGSFSYVTPSGEIVEVTEVQAGAPLQANKEEKEALEKFEGTAVEGKEPVDRFDVPSPQELLDTAEGTVKKVPEAVETPTDVRELPSTDLVSHEGAPDEARVVEFMGRISKGEAVEPLLVIKEGDKFGIEDGKHRFEAFKRLGVENIPVKEVGEGGVALVAETPAAKVTAIKVGPVQEVAQTFKQNQPAVEQAMGEILAELEVSEAGQRIFTEGGVISTPSTFPKWVPEELRSKKLFEKVMGGLSIENFAYPSNNAPRQQELFDFLLDEIDSRVGIDTSKARADILKVDGKPQIKKTIDSSAKRGKKPLTKTAQKKTVKLAQKEVTKAPKAKKPKPTTLKPSGRGKKKISKLGVGVEAKAIEKQLTEGFQEIPEYRQVNVKNQLARAEKLYNENKQLAIDIALGKEQPKFGLLPESVFTTVENKALEEGNIDLLRQLAVSTRVSEATAMGQRIRLLAERNPDSAVTKIRELTDARKKILEEKRGFSLEKETKRIQKSVSREVNKIRKGEWNNFIDSIEC